VAHNVFGDKPSIHGHGSAEQRPILPERP